MTDPKTPEKKSAVERFGIFAKAISKERGMESWAEHDYHAIKAEFDALKADLASAKAEVEMAHSLLRIINEALERGETIPAIVPFLTSGVISPDDIKWAESVLASNPAATAPAQDDGWLPWNGGECPVGGDTLVDVGFKDGDTNLRQSGGDWEWYHDGRDDDIIKYRIVSESAAFRATGSLNDIMKGDAACSE